MELEDKLHKKIVSLCENGDLKIEKGKTKDGLTLYNKALDLVPEPKTNWEASTWIYAAIGDVYFISEEYQKSKDTFFEAANCPDGITNPFVLLRIGQCCVELSEESKAKEYLLKAYMLEGAGIFQNEDEKYFTLIKKLT